jgi:hypothetical protein
VDLATERRAHADAGAGIIPVMNRRLPWLLMLPLMAAGCLAAHSAAYRLVEPTPAESTTHGYLALAPLVLAVGIALGVVAALRSALAGRIGAGGPAYLFALLPPLAFTLQEHLERAFQPGESMFGTAFEPSFLVGLALQLPFALLALVIARTLLRVVEAAGALLRPPTVALRTPPVLRLAYFVDAPRLRALSSRHAGRAPPLPA